MKDPKKDISNLEVNRGRKLAKRVQRLKSLILDQSFSNKDSIAYNAAMYHLIRILEIRVQEDKVREESDKKYPGLNILRNGLVHGYFDIEPQEVIDFVNAEIDNLSNKHEILYLDHYPIFLRSYKYSFNARNQRISDYEAFYFNLSPQSMYQQIEYHYLYEMQQQQARIASFGEVTAYNRDAILYCIGVFGEAGNQLKSMSNDPNKELMLGYCREWRNQVFHDTGESREGEYIFPDSEISDKKIRATCGIISRYDFYNQIYAPLLTETVTTSSSGFILQSNMDMSALIEMARKQVEEHVEVIVQEEVKESPIVGIGSSSSSSSSDPTQLEPESEVTEEEEAARKTKRARLEENTESPGNVEGVEDNEVTTEQGGEFTERERLRRIKGKDKENGHSPS